MADNNLRRRPAAGEPAPGFAARNQFGETVELSELRGARGVVLMFYPFAFSRVCGSELAEIRDRWAEFGELGVRLLAISCDSVHTLRAYAEELARQGGPDSGAVPVEFDLLSDYWPHGQIARSYGAFNEDLGCPTRDTFVLDGQLNVRAVVSAAHTQSRDIQELLAGLQLVARE
ncbi:redoxin domain-containing protein [Nesterenkonia alkaliphila]|uniref:Redoxin domain-containing protein n=1 Tax=Nesterenkonia alkaliphila TaxID=1463631 RepID=A0A7K1ULX5_9MICC|nr:redoxin domain-containing protein [Nesterenkonia alkaliphila]MVT27489.1 redoxin domain-containing protein [Nesterenkonia alkaliphila]GFZ89304.1 peroxiredoxin [Nesterenkonia alkaliphila]